MLMMITEGYALRLIIGCHHLPLNQYLSFFYYGQYMFLSLFNSISTLAFSTLLPSPSFFYFLFLFSTERTTMDSLDDQVILLLVAT